MWKKPKKKKVLAPTTEKLKQLREEEFNRAMKKSHKFFLTMKKCERLTKEIGHATKNVGHKTKS